MRAPRLIIFLFISFLMWISVRSQSVQGVVWYDADLNGSIDIGEPGISGVAIFLLRCNGQFIQSTISDINGEYEFLNLTADSYKIYVNKVHLPSAYKPTVYDASTDNAVQSNYYSLCHAVTQTTDINAGFGIPSTLGDIVWEDVDYDGVQDFGEPGIPNIIVSAYLNGVLVSQTSSNINGQYQFDNLFPGSYTLKFEGDDIYQPTILHSGNTSLDSDAFWDNGEIWTAPINVSANQIVLDVDAGFYQCIEFCGHIYNDANSNNLLETSENGINQLDIRLWQIIDGDTVLAGNDVTGQEPGLPSDDGYYRFCVPPGTYFIQVIMPNAAWIAGEPFVGPDPNVYNFITHNNGVNTTNTFVVLSGDAHCNINNGFYCSPIIEAYVWEDLNQDGIMDNTEDRIPNVEVYLMDQNIVVGITETDINGKYAFDSIQPNHCYVKFPADMNYTVPFATGSAQSNLDSKVNDANGYGTTPTINLSACSQIDFLNAGVLRTVLPVRWKYVNGAQSGDNVTIRWALYDAVNVSHYTILTSEKGDRWTSIGSSDATDEKTYSYTDSAMLFGDFVKVVAVDFDGRRSESAIVQIAKDNNVKLQIFPNPTDDKVYFNNNEFHSLKIFDLHGKSIAELDALHLEFVSLKHLNLKAGVYIFEFISNQETLSQKIIFKE